MSRFPVSNELKFLLRVLTGAGGYPYVVGGSVRDFHLGLSPKDIDVEVFGLSADNLHSALSNYFPVDAVGKQFGVLKVRIESSTIDVSLPRTENKTGRKHDDFDVTVKPFLSFKEAAWRRDFTINAMGWDLVRDVLDDPYNGQGDLADGCLRHVSTAFGEDPLRILRACQFAARFGFEIHPSTIEICHQLVPEINHLPPERKWEEFKKLLLKSERPSIGFEALQQTWALMVFPELQALVGVPQDPEWHPEGDVWIHNNMVVDSAAMIVRRDNLPEDEALLVLLGSLCHDFGKPAVTEMMDGRWRAHGHEAAGVEPTRSFLTQIGAPPSIIEAVIPLVEHHLKPHHLYRDRASKPAIRRLALKAPLQRLCWVAEADHLGRTTPDALEGQCPSVRWIMAQAKDLRLENSKPRGILLGRHLLALGIPPGPDMGKILAQAFEVQLDGGFEDEAGAIVWATQEVKNGPPKA